MTSLGCPATQETLPLRPGGRLRVLSPSRTNPGDRDPGARDCCTDASPHGFVLQNAESPVDARGRCPARQVPWIWRACLDLKPARRRGSRGARRKGGDNRGARRADRRAQAVAPDEGDRRAGCARGGAQELTDQGARFDARLLSRSINYANPSASAPRVEPGPPSAACTTQLTGFAEPRACSTTAPRPGTQTASGRP